MENNNLNIIAIASEKNNIESVVCSTAGRTPYFLLFENKNLIKVIKNPFAKGSGGAGFSVAHMLAKEKVNLVIAGKFGSNMIPVLEEKGIKYKEIPNKTISQALEGL
jgi:predicted Fe-Mo cluster-binding NifX family protein